jgi:hypothetical protein
MELALLLWLRLNEHVQLACVDDSDCTVVSENKRDTVTNRLFEPEVRSNLVALGPVGGCRYGVREYLTAACHHLQCTAEYHEYPRDY